MKALILLHGALGAKDQLQPLADTLQNGFNVHAINFSGHGGTAFPSNRFSIELFAQDVLQYMQQHEIRNASVFGYSMGGYVGMYLAKHFPERIAALITLATKYHWDAGIAEKEIKMLDPAIIQEKVPAFAKELAMRHAPQDWRELLFRTAQLLTSLGAESVLNDADLTSISSQCLLMLGDRDKMVTLEETVNVYKRLQNASLAVLPCTGHPLEKADVSLLDFLIRRFLIQTEE